MDQVDLSKVDWKRIFKEFRSFQKRAKEILDSGVLYRLKARTLFIERQFGITIEIEDILSPFVGASEHNLIKHLDIRLTEQETGDLSQICCG